MIVLELFEDKWGEISHHLILGVIICYRVNLCSHKPHQYDTDYFILRPQIATQFPNECNSPSFNPRSACIFCTAACHSRRFSQSWAFQKKKKGTKRKEKKAEEKSEELREDREKKNR